MSDYTVTLVVAAALLLAGCPGKREIQQIQSDLDEIKRQVYEVKRLEEETSRQVKTLAEACGVEGLRTTQADLNQTVDTLRGDVRALATRLDAQARQEAALAESLERCLSMSQRPAPSYQPAESSSLLSPATAPEQRAETLYKAAYGDYIRDNFDMAIQGFKQLLDAYPQSELADNAAYWIAESHYRQGKRDDALRSFDDLVRQYPRGDKVADALVRKAFILFETRQPAQAAVILNEVMERFPGTPAAAQAREKLKSEGFLR